MKTGVQNNLAIEQIYATLQYSGSKKEIANYAPSFMKFLWRILEEESSAKIVLNLLKIINLVFENEEILDKINIQSIASHLVKKLAFSNVQIRRLSMQAFISIMK